MKVLLDENIPRRLIQLLPGHEVSTVPQNGWAGIKNGNLLALANAKFEAFITMDQGISYQQNLTGKQIRMLILRARSNRLEDVAPLAPVILAALPSIAAGSLTYLDSSEWD